MLGPILQGLSQQVAQFVASPAFPQLVNNLQRIPLVYWFRGAQVASASVSSWYSSLSEEDKKRLEGAIAWAAKDLSGDVIDAATGLPIGSFVVEKVLAYLGHDNNSSEHEKAFIRYELQRQLKI